MTHEYSIHYDHAVFRAADISASLQQNNEQSALHSPNIRLTMWAPVDSAFSPSVQIPPVCFPLDLPHGLLLGADL